MTIEVRQVADVAVLLPSGKLTGASGGPTLRNAVQTALNSGSAKIVVNLGSVTTVDSSGIGDLVSATTTARNRGANVKFSNVPTGVALVLTMTKVSSLIEAYDTEAEAIASFP